MEDIEQTKTGEKLERLKRNLVRDVTEYYNTWSDPIVAGHLLRPYSSMIGRLGTSTGDILEELELLGIIRVVRSPDNKRYIFPAEALEEGSEEDFLQQLIEKEKSLLLQRGSKK